MFKIHFVTLNEKWISLAKEVFGEDIKISHCNVETINTSNTVFVSPANSLGYMDGGIDLAYSRIMFPNCDIIVKEKIKQIGLKTMLGRPYIPVGSALYISLLNSLSYYNCGLIVAPTMFLPHDVSSTQNAYHSFLAALLQFEKVRLKYQYTTLILTSHCCGYGKMSEEESVKQMKAAYDDFIKYKELSLYKNDSSKDIDVLLMPSRDEDQPNNYDNREIKNIDIKDLMK